MAREAALTAAAETREIRRNIEKLIESVESLQRDITELKGCSVSSMCLKLPKYEFTDQNDVDLLSDGHDVLALLCFQQLRLVKSLKNIPSTLNEYEKYALIKGFHHMRLAGGFEYELLLCVTDLQLLSSMLFAFSGYHSRFCSELKSVIEVLKLSSLDLEEYTCIADLEEFMAHLFPLDTCPLEHCIQIVFQAAIYCSEENFLRKKAMHLLGTPKYHHLPWMEFTNGGWEHLSELMWITDFSLSLDRKIALCIGLMDNCKFFIGTFNTESRTCIVSDVIEEPVFRCAISSATYNAVGAVATDSGVKLIDLHTLQTLHVFKTEGSVGCCFLSQGTQLAVGYGDRAVRVWDIRTLKLKTELTFHNEVIDLCIPLPGNRLLTGDLVGTLLLWKSLEPEPQHVKVTDLWRRGEWCGYRQTVAVSPDQTKIAVLCRLDFVILSSCVVNLFSAVHGQMLMQFDECPSHCSIFFIDNSHILCGEDDKLKFLNAESTDEKRKPKVLWYQGAHNIAKSLYRISKLELKFVGHFVTQFSIRMKAMEFTLHNIV